jgi:hypothetical protein
MFDQAGVEGVSGALPAPFPLRGGRCRPQGGGRVNLNHAAANIMSEHCRSAPSRPLRGHPPLNGEGA